MRYCVDLKGENIAQNYILQVARNFAAEGVTTVEQIENKLSDYVVRSGDAAAVLRAMGSSRKPEPEDYKLLKKWTDELGFGMPAILHTASLHKKGTFARLDAALQELYANKKFSEGEIGEYLSRKTQIRSLTISIAKELGVYCQVVDTYTDNFVSGWLAAGYDDASLLQLAKYCFRRGKKSFEKMDELIKKLTERGAVSAESIVAYMEAEAREQAFIGEILHAAGLSRKGNNWDRECLRTWRGWNFSDEMILKAAELANGKTSPIPYMNSVLSSWKAKEVFTPEQIKKEEPQENFYRQRQREEQDGEFRRKVRNYYFNLREKAEDRAEHFCKLARSDAQFKENEEAVRTADLALAKAEAAGKDAAAERERLQALRSARAEILAQLGITEEMLVPQYRCKICNDTGFDADGNICECYKKFVEDASDDKKLENILDVYSNIEI